MFGFLSQYTSPLKLMRMGIMGMNQRNVNYIGRYNKRKLYPLVDNKLLTKKMALAHHVNTPNLVGSVRNQVDAQNIVEIIGDKSEFCIKPAQGSGGKGYGSDANPEFIAKIRSVLDEAGVCFQFTEIGKVDQGGGGTIAELSARYCMNVIDAGIAVLSMHSPYEVVSKADVYETYLGYSAFLRDIK